MHNKLKDFLKEKNILHWLWTLDGTARACDWASKELGKSIEQLFPLAMDLRGTLEKNEEFLETKPDEIKEIDRQIEDMMTNPDSIYREKYDE